MEQTGHHEYMAALGLRQRGIEVCLFITCLVNVIVGCDGRHNMNLLRFSCTTNLSVRTVTAANNCRCFWVLPNSYITVNWIKK